MTLDRDRFLVRRRSSWICFALSLLLTAGCSNSDPKVLLGSWRADKARFEGLTLPISPNFEVTNSEVILRTYEGSEIARAPWSAIRADGNSVEIEVKGFYGVGFVFEVQSSDKIAYRVPLVGTTINFSREVVGKSR